MNILKKIRIILSIIKRNLLWKTDSVIIKNNTKKKTIGNTINGKIIILIPHADDEWIGCSQLITSNSKNIIFVNTNMGGGDSEEVHKKRCNELKQLSQKFDIKLVSLDVNKRNVDMLIDVIKNENPTNIALPFYIDWHKEHLEVMRMLKATYEKMHSLGIDFIKDINIIMYQVSVPIPNELVSDCIPMDKSKQKEKWTTFDEIYQSQSNIPWKRFQYNEYINGGICNSYAAEVYVKDNFKIWCSYIEQRILDENTQRKLVENLQNLRKIRKIANMNVNM